MRPTPLPTLIYLHGFCSSPASWKARVLAEVLYNRGLGHRLGCQALPPIPDQALACVEAILAETAGTVTLAGSSLGGHYATWLAEKHGHRAVLINPAVIHRLDPQRFLGEHANFHTGERFSFTVAHAAQLAAQSVPAPNPERYLLLVETGDEVLDYRHAVEHYAGCRQIVVAGGDHSFTKFPEFIPQILEFAGL